MPLPPALANIFWEYDFRKLSWERDRDLVIGRVLSHGAWEDIRWLRSAVADETLRAWILRAHGRGLSPQQIRYWQLVLVLPDDVVDAWLSDPARQLWQERVRRAPPRKRAL